MSRFRFNPVGGHPSQPWFRIGEFDVTTTILAIGVTLFSMVVYAASETAVVENLSLLPQSAPGAPLGVLDGAIWKLLSWPLVNKPSGWAFISLLLFFFWGSRVESDLGRTRMAWLLLWMALVPAVIVTIVQSLTDDRIYPYAGMRFIGVGIFVAFAVEYPHMRFFFNIPTWVIATGFVFLDILGILSDRAYDFGNYAYFVLLLYVSVLATAVFVTRQFGLADAASFIPRLNWPGMKRAGAPARQSKPARRKKSKSQADLTVVPQWTPPRPHDVVHDREIDELLDKIAAHGLDSLSPEERRRLDQASKRLRDRKD